MGERTVSVARWSGSARPTNADLVGLMKAEGMRFMEWANRPGDRYGEHAHSYDKVLVCLAGSIVFQLSAPEGAVELTPGDKLRIPAGVRHNALVGSRGVRCAEAHLTPADAE